MSIGKMSALAFAGPQALTVTWDDGRTARIDLAGRIAARRVLAPLADEIAFASAALSADGWSIEWPCGIDFGAPQLRRWADEQAGDTMPADAFRAWMTGHGLTLDAAASALGLSRRTIAYYLSGEHAIPKTVLLATRGYDRPEAA